MMAEKKIGESISDSLDEDDDFTHTVASGRLSFDSDFSGRYSAYVDSDGDDDPDISQFSGDVCADSILRGYSFSDMARVRKTLSFVITDSDVVTEGSKKFVMYTVSVLRSPGVDTDSAIVHRRFNSFCDLDRGLRKSHPEILARSVPKLPKKKVFGNLNLSTIEERRLQLEAYLSGISAFEEIRKTDVYKEFFYVRDLREACSCLRAGKYMESYKLLLNGLHLQEKLGMHFQEEIASTLCSIVVVCIAMDKLQEAEKYACAALEILQKNISSIYNLPLLNTTIELQWRLGKDKTDLEKRLVEVQRLSKQDVESVNSLRELAAGRFS